MIKDISDKGVILEELGWVDPLALFAPLAHEPFALFLDSATAGPGREAALHGRWSFIAADPVCTLKAEPEGRALLDGSPCQEPAFDLIARLLARHRLEKEDLPEAARAIPFTGGLAGTIGYEMACALEDLPALSKDPLPTLALGLYDVVLAFDHQTRKLFLISTGLGEEKPPARAARAEARAAKWRARIALNPALTPLHWPLSPQPAHSVRALKTPDAYKADIARVIAYIHAGDIFQANLSQRFESDLTPDETPFLLYRRLRAHSPAPFAGFFNLEEGALLSSSPERFLSSDGKTAQTKPIKGTRPRGGTAKEDAALAAELQASGKDRAENVMIVDLMRNDFSRVCKDGSLRVPALCALESYANVHHLVSTVEGELCEGKTALDLLMAAFPGGSITGAPKIRAMEVIAELEQNPRGIYCGSFGYLGLDGRMDMNISIRTMSIAGGKARFNAGGGIVADSDPQEEYEESLAKASAMRAALLGIRPDERANESSGAKHRS